MAARDSLVLGAGSVVAGLLAYVFFAVATRVLGAAAAAPVSVLWTYWAATAAVLTFPLQHWTIRTLAADRHEGTVARSLPRIWLATLALTLATAVAAYAARGALFDDDSVAFPLMTGVLTVGACLDGLVRGGLSGRRRYVATTLAMNAENGLRVALAVVVAVAGGGPEAFGWALALGAVALLAWPSALRFRRDEAHAGQPLNSPLALVSGLAGGSLIAQVVLTGAPIVLAAAGGSGTEVTSLFVALAVLRAPYIIALGMTPQLTSALTRLVVQGRSATLRRIRLLVLAAVLAGAGVAALIGATILLPVLRLVFGDEVGLARGQLALLGAGTAVALGNLFLLLLHLAYGRSHTASAAWLAALVGAAGWVLLGPGGPLTRTVVAFSLAQAVAFALLVAAGGPPAVATSEESSPVG